MVKIRLRRLGQKHRPFYRIVVAEANTGRNGKFVETIGIYDPVAQPKRLEVKEERALHWLRHGAQPTETAAYILNKLGVLPKYLEERPSQAKKYSFLDKRTPATAAAMPAVEEVESEIETEAAADAAPEAAAETAPTEPEATAPTETTETA
ncbi:MAG: 30S ribosomal protein S16 [Fimbriimonadaceae bacterium]|nr:30S ribosomal protein S16 [Fimbriimonadaceae bacterium]